MNFRSQQNRLDEIEREFRKAERKLHNSDGSRIYSTTEHNRQLQELRDWASDALAEVESEIQEAAAEAKDTLGHRQHLPQQFEAVEYVNLLERAMLFREDIERMAAPELALRLEAIERMGTGQERKLHARYAGFRLQAHEDELRSGAPVDPDGWLEVRQAYDKLAAKIADPAIQRDAEALEDARSAAMRLTMEVSRLRRELVQGVNAVQDTERRYAENF